MHIYQHHDAQKFTVVKVVKCFWNQNQKGWWEHYNIHVAIAVSLNRLLNRLFLWQMSLRFLLTVVLDMTWKFFHFYWTISPHINIANEINTYVLMGTTEPTSLHNLTYVSEHAHTGCVSGSVCQAADLHHARCLLWPVWQGVCLQICPSLCREVEVIHTHIHSHTKLVAWDD